MTDHPAPSAPEEPSGGPQSAEQPAPGPRVESPRPNASGGHTATPAERAALTELIRLTEDMGLYEDRQPAPPETFHACPPDCPGCNAPGGVGECGPEDRPAAHSCRNCAGIDPDTCLANPDRPKPTPDTPDAARYARWLAVIRGDRGLDPAIAHAITAAAIREADDEHTGIQLACAEQAARAEAHLEGVSAEADGWQRRYEQAERRLAQLRARSDRHVYLSTGCLHGQHGYCQGKNGLAGPKTPAQCKFCAAPCVCDCHHGDGPAVPAGGSDQRQCPGFVPDEPRAPGLCAHCGDSKAWHRDDEDRHTADTITDDALAALYERLDAAEATETQRQLATAREALASATVRAARAEAAIRAHAPTLADEDRRERYAAALYEQGNPGFRWTDAHPDDRRAFLADADAVLPVADAEVRRLTGLLGEYADRGIANGERAERAEAALDRVRALTDRWAIPGHISMPQAAADIREALDRSQP